MKIRNGFVSNSSSSSFCIFGVVLESYDLQKKFKIKGHDGNLYDVLYNKLKEFKYLSQYPHYCSEYWGIGFNLAHIASLDENMTFKQIKELVTKELRELLNDESLELTIHEASWQE